MELELGNVQKPVRQLRNSLRSLPANPPIKYVHDLRTRARRVEAITRMLIPGHEHSRRHLLKLLKPLRKAAGSVRDMDVLAAKARTLARHRPNQTRNQSIDRLLAHLRATRTESALELLHTLANQRKAARGSLKQFSRQIEKHFQAIDSHPAAIPTAASRIPAPPSRSWMSSADGPRSTLKISIPSASRSRNCATFCSSSRMQI